ncbi:MAG TPA: hypothetical protein VGM84_27265 [Steroidobacteraceae bacterium]|jgi:hypothetical protein
MGVPTWKLLTTFTDHPSALSLAEVLSSHGIPVRLSSEASVMGWAATTRLFVEAHRHLRARNLLPDQTLSDEELTGLATGTLGTDES